MQLKLLYIIPAVALFLSGCSPYRQLTYEEDTADFVNPERGFYIPTGTKAGSFVGLDAAALKKYREDPQQTGKSTYKVKVSLIYRGYELDIFKNKPFSAEFLDNLQRDFAAVRKAGLKMILRFAYTNTATGGDCKDEYKICPPYGDAPVHIVMHHIRQLKPLLQENADVIAVMQEGFIGIWGENYFTDHFGDASTNGAGVITDSSWRLRNELLKALLDALPSDRMVQVRTPQIKQKYVYSPPATVNSFPLTREEAFREDNKSRIGFHNDCFLSNADDYGTYYDYGSSTQPRQPANEVLRKYIEADTKFTAVGGETCDDAFSPQNDCAPAGHAEEEMRRMHYSYLNAAYNTDVSNDWDSGGCLENIRKNLGYRFVIRNISMTGRLGPMGSFHISFRVENKGYASPYNPRPVQLVFRNRVSGREYVAALKTIPRFWFTGNTDVSEQVALPADIIQGEYWVYLSLPDPAPSLKGRPEYSIRLANKNMWEEATGYNNLHHIVTVK